MRLELRDLLLLGFPKPILAAGQDLVFILFFCQVSSLFSHSRKLCAQLIFAAVVFQVQARPPALGFSLLPPPCSLSVGCQSALLPGPPDSYPRIEFLAGACLSVIFLMCFCRLPNLVVLVLFCVKSLQVIAGVVLELSDQKTQDFIILIFLKRLFFKYACKLFSEMTMRT
jgi:hypothetical protein